MFKYDQFPILRLEVYNSEGVLHRKLLRLKSHRPYYECSTHSLTNVIDFQTSEHLTLKKIFKTKNLSKDSTLAELYNQSKMRGNDNFIQIKQVYEDHENIYLLMEQNHDHLHQILAERVTLFQRQLVTILESLRRNNVFHGGICLSNLFLDKKTMKVKLSGFTHSVNMEKVKQSQHTNVYTLAQPTPYTAPELFDNAKLFENIIKCPYTYYAADIWAVGVVIYTLLIGEEPFTHYDEVTQIKTTSTVSIKRYMYTFPRPELDLSMAGKRSRQSISVVWKQLLKKIFQPKDDRISLHDLIHHPLNMITESKFTRLSCKQPPTIANHLTCSEEEILNSIRFCPQTQKQLHQQKQNSSLLSSSSMPLRAPPRLNCSQPPSYCSSAPSYCQPKQLLTGGQVNTMILRILLKQQQQRLPAKQPLVSRQPSYIQRYCYIRHLNCIGYVLQNTIGVVFDDGSCVVGQNSNEYSYVSNRCDNMDEALGSYCALYDQCYDVMRVGMDGNGNGMYRPRCRQKSKQRQKQRQGQEQQGQGQQRWGQQQQQQVERCRQHIPNSNGNGNGNGNGNSNGSMRGKGKGKGGVSRTKFKNYTIDRSIEQHNSNTNSADSNTQANDCVGNYVSSVNANTNYDTNRNYANTNKSTVKNLDINPNTNINTNININGNMFNNPSLVNSINASDNNNSTHGTLTKPAISKTHKSKILSSPLPSSFPPSLSHAINKQTSLNSNILNMSYNNYMPDCYDTIPEAQFGESMCEFKNTNHSNLQPIPDHKYYIYEYFLNYFGERVIQSDIDFYVIGFWAIDGGFVFLYSNGAWQINLSQGIDPCKSIQGTMKIGRNGEKTSILVNDYKRSKEAAVILDKYGIGWWLKPKSSGKYHGGMEMPYDNGILNTKKAKNSIENINANTLNQSYNWLCVKIGRRVVSRIKDVYIKEYEHIMEPYKYAYF